MPESSSTTAVSALESLESAERQRSWAELVEAIEHVGGQVLRDHQNVDVTPLIEVATSDGSEDDCRTDP